MPTTQGRVFKAQWPVHRPCGGCVGRRLVWLAVCEGQGEEEERQAGSCAGLVWGLLVQRKGFGFPSAAAGGAEKGCAPTPGGKRIFGVLC